MPENTPPERYKNPDELSGDETLKVVQAQNAGKPEPRFETKVYRDYRGAALRAAGLDDEAAAAEPTELEDQSVEEHFQRIRKGNR